MDLARFKAWGALIGIAAFVTSSFGAEHGKPSCCMCGKKVCVLEVSKGEEDVLCFSVEPKEICIPGIKFPWDRCGTYRCGGVRSICVLKEETKEKTICTYDWSIKVICTHCCKQHGLRHSARHAQVNRDERVPFEYYVEEPLPPRDAASLPPTPLHKSSIPRLETSSRGVGRNSFRQSVLMVLAPTE